MARIVDVMETVDATYWDTVEFGERQGRNIINAFGQADVVRRDRTNMVIPGMFPGDSVFAGERVMFGAPVETLKAWEGIRWGLLIGAKEYFGVPLWMKPDAVLGAKDVVVEGWDFSKTETPLDWTFLEWRFPFYVACRQNVCVRMEHDGSEPPAGMVRVAMRGKMTRDVM